MVFLFLPELRVSVLWWIGGANIPVASCGCGAVELSAIFTSRIDPKKHKHTGMLLTSGLALSWAAARPRLLASRARHVHGSSIWSCFSR